MKRPWKPHFYTHSGPLPEGPVLERACARELLTTWEITKDKDLVDRHLAASEKIYGKGAEMRIRRQMREVKRDERSVKQYSPISDAEEAQNQGERASSRPA